MLRSTLLRSRRAPLQPRTLLRKPPYRHFANEPTPQSSQSRIARINRRLPNFLHKYTNALASAPVSHITSFLLLHELTAVIPLFGLAAAFHYTHWLPSWFAEGAWVLQGVERFGKYFRKKGWIGKGEKDEAEREVKLRRRDRAWNVGEGGVRWVVEFATAYAIVKMLIPVRIVFSVWATPWFAERTVVPVGRAMARWFGRGSSKAGGSGAAGTGATGGKVIEKVKKPGNGEGG